MIRYLAFIGFALAATAALAGPSGPATVLDGNTIEVGGARLRLHGIDAPDLDQPCRLRGRDAECGVLARAALMDLTAGAEVVCEPKGVDRAGRALATCLAGDYDLSEGMVYTGWALALPDGPSHYHTIQRKAEAARRGMWLGEFVPPAAWRRQKP
jgi:endonuclease YncB( thermonuclease family)